VPNARFIKNTVLNAISSNKEQQRIEYCKNRMAKEDRLRRNLLAKRAEYEKRKNKKRARSRSSSSSSSDDDTTSSSSPSPYLKRSRHRHKRQKTNETSRHSRRHRAHRYTRTRDRVYERTRDRTRDTIRRSWSSSVCSSSSSRSSSEHSVSPVRKEKKRHATNGKSHETYEEKKHVSGEKENSLTIFEASSPTIEIQLEEDTYRRQTRTVSSEEIPRKEGSENISLKTENEDKETMLRISRMKVRGRGSVGSKMDALESSVYDPSSPTPDTWPSAKPRDLPRTHVNIPPVPVKPNTDLFSTSSSTSSSSESEDSSDESSESEESSEEVKRRRRSAKKKREEKLKKSKKKRIEREKLRKKAEKKKRERKREKKRREKEAKEKERRRERRRKKKMEKRMREREENNV